ncbi:11-beta-hydroxysteroid dehydrogenase-like 5 [Quillaja saponaria]|uniref:11-beta-hydroxysteroid dehydrogenase-like 5 n=1 Tax=Quillaja saponaria TaxID=32244 RepID=A0AAD7QJT4_QUISA|nr:11-beta-hydroxysteroid dehydrogenase-like 5 [Quillaja saponaria]
MDLVNTFLNWVVPPASLMMLAFAWPALTFINSCEWLYNSLYSENMDSKVVIITGASSGIGEQIAYEYAKRGANLVLVARRENRLRLISENARRMGARHVMIMAADVVKEDDCRRFVYETFNFHGRVDHLVNAASLGHTFYFQEVTDTSVFPRLLDINFWGNVYPTYVALPYLHQSNGRVIVNASVESWLPLPRMSLYSAAKAALVNFYETLRIELKDDVGVTIATHGWVGSEMTRGKFMLEEGADNAMERRKRSACDWVFTPNVLSWTFRLLLSTHVMRRTSLVGTGRPITEGAAGRPMLEGTPPRKLIAGGPITFSQLSPQQQQKLE